MPGMPTNKSRRRFDAAFEAACTLRKPSTGLIVHSDRGSQYTSEAFKGAIRARGAVQSMGRTGSCFDNAAAESWFATLKEELIYRHSWPTRRKAIAGISDYIDNFYNPRRRHSANGLTSPIEREIQFRIRSMAA